MNQTIYKFAAAVLVLGIVAWASMKGHERSIPDMSPDDVAKLTHSLDDLTARVKSLQQEVNSLKSTPSPGGNSGIGSASATTPNPPPSNAPWFPVAFAPDSSSLDDPFLGPKDAAVVMMAFSDYECQTCRRFYKETFPQLQKDFIATKRIKYIFRDYPLPGHQNAFTAAAYAQCAGEQGAYWRLHDLFFENPREVEAGLFEKLISDAVKKQPKNAKKLDLAKLKTCAESSRYVREINSDIAEAKKLGAKGAPGFFIGSRESDGTLRGVFIRGAQPFQVFEQQLLRHLKDTV